MSEDGQRLFFTVEIGARIDLMRRYEAIALVPGYRYQYVVNDLILKEKDRLSDHNIENNSVIQIVISLQVTFIFFF